MRDLVLGVICLAAAWFIYVKMLQTRDLFALGIPILLGVISGVVFHNWARGLLFLHPVLWFAYLQILDRMLSPYWRKPEWVNSLLLFVLPILPGVAAYLPTRSLSVGLLYLTPWALSLTFLALWASEQRRVRQIAKEHAERRKR